MIYCLERKQTIPGNLSDIWSFFSNPQNLPKITPPELNFSIRSNLPERIYPGLIIEYRVTPLFGIPVTWLTEITHVREPFYFVDEQRVGPYAVWHHEHFFQPATATSVTITDRIHYVLPFSPLTKFLHGPLIAPKLQRIFDFRKNAIEKIFTTQFSSPSIPNQSAN
ncbi:MAG: SRPBCC family protein [Chthoniobacterales bacterium]|nr:SRPBCC family protein [Chthoniobacterales bacterium]